MLKDSVTCRPQGAGIEPMTFPSSDDSKLTPQLSQFYSNTGNSLVYVCGVLLEAELECEQDIKTPDLIVELLILYHASHCFCHPQILQPECFHMEKTPNSPPSCVTCILSLWKCFLLFFPWLFMFVSRIPIDFNSGVSFLLVTSKAGQLEDFWLRESKW